MLPGRPTRPIFLNALFLVGLSPNFSAMSDTRTPGEGQTVEAQPARQPAFNAPPVTLALCGVVLLVFAALRLLPTDWAFTALHTFSIVPARLAGAVAEGSAAGLVGEAMTLITYAAIHYDMAHIALNLGFLLAFGSLSERALGRRRYLWLLLGTTIVAALTQLAVDWAEPLMIHGASGAVAGCMGAAVRLMLRPGASQAQRRFAIGFVAVLAVVNVGFGVLSPVLLGEATQVAWEAHIGGFLAGLVLAGPPWRRHGNRPMAAA